MTPGKKTQIEYHCISAEHLLGIPESYGVRTWQLGRRFKKAFAGGASAFRRLSGQDVKHSATLWRFRV